MANKINIHGLPAPDKQKTLENGQISRVWKSGARSVRLRTGHSLTQLTVFSGKQRIMDHFGGEEYAVGYVQAFVSVPQPA